ncbi:hypothetical protein N1851_023167 [Merluccius polli]|uniref:Uncharacterized protein n=1 Tax=Merluccius polli TaxID=89951 RepID=A0AA47NWW7_MERPO|nr:hypothetical protein N1851_023167 [Merluccius polli]
MKTDHFIVIRLYWYRCFQVWQNTIVCVCVCVLHRRHQERSKVTSAQSVQQYPTELIQASLCRPAGRESRTDASDVLSEFRVKFSLMFVLLQRAEEDAHTFLDKELKKLWRSHFPDYPQCSESQREEEDAKKGEQRRRAVEGVVDITKLCLMEMNQEELANKLNCCCEVQS